MSEIARVSAKTHIRAAKTTPAKTNQVESSPQIKQFEKLGNDIETALEMAQGIRHSLENVLRDPLASE